MTKFTFIDHSINNGRMFGKFCKWRGVEDSSSQITKGTRLEQKNHVVLCRYIDKVPVNFFFFFLKTGQYPIDVWGFPIFRSHLLFKIVPGFQSKEYQVIFRVWSLSEVDVLWTLSRVGSGRVGLSGETLKMGARVVLGGVTWEGKTRDV